MTPVPPSLGQERVAEELGAVEEGAAGPLVTFVHGVVDRGRTFEPVIELLGRECRTLRYDRRGYGTPTRDPVGVAGHADDLLALLGGRRSLLVGHSFGGMTALAAAARAPELVSAVVLYETPVAWAPGWGDEVMLEIMAGDDPVLAGVRMFYARYDAMGPGDRARRRAFAAAFIAEERSVRGEVRPFALRDVRAPVLYGRSDPKAMAAVVEHLAHELPQLELAVIPGAGHHAHRTEPEAFAGLVRRGLELAAAP